MKTNIYPISIILLILNSFLFSCGKDHKLHEQKNDFSFKQPITIVESAPIVIISDTCPKPITIIIPAKDSITYIVRTKDGNKIKKCPPLRAAPLNGGEAGGYTFMQNFNTEQGLALSSICCGYKDRCGNMWFGTQGGGASRYDGKSFTNYTANQGLANNTVLCITEDKNGNMWFGTNGGGVSKYDGKCFTNFTTEQGLVNNRVYSIAEEKNGNLWFSTIDGISRFTPASIRSGKPYLFTNFNTNEGLIYNAVICSLIDTKGNIWFGTEKGLSIYNQEILPASPTVTESGVQNKSSVFAGNSSSLSGRSVGALFTNYTTDQGLSNNYIKCILEDKTGNIWLGTMHGGISKYDPTVKLHPEKKSAHEVISAFSNYKIAPGDMYENVYCITEDKTGNIWFGTAGGVSRYNPKVKHPDGADIFTNFSTAQGVSNKNIRSITEDKTGNLWIGTAGSGLSKYGGKSVTSYTNEQGLETNMIWGITEDNKGNLWFVGGSTVCRFDRKSFTNFGSGIYMPNLRCAVVDKMGNIWFGSTMGVTKFDGKSFTDYTMAQGLPHNTVLSIAEDKIGNIWFGTYGGGVSKYDGNRVEAIEKGETIFPKNLKGLKKLDGKFVKTFTNYSNAQGLAGNIVKCIIEDEVGNMWFGTNGYGVSKYDGNRVDAVESGDVIALKTQLDLKKINGKLVKTFTNYSKVQGLSNNTIYSIMEDKAGSLWFGTAGGGVCRYSPKIEVAACLPKAASVFTNYTSAQGLADNNVYDIVEDTLNNMIWMGTNIGLSGLKLNSLNSGTHEPEFENFNNKTGYPIKDLNTGALYLDKKGIIWAGTSEKLVRFDYSSILKYTEPPAVFIQAVKIHGENISWYNLKLKGLNGDKMNEADSLAVINEEIITYNHTLTEIQRDAIYKEFSDIKFDSINRCYPVPQNLVLPYGHNNISLDFLAIETSRPFMVNYQYILDGYDKEWSPKSNKTTAEFGNIHEGSYTFKVKALGPDGVWSEPLIYKFKVLPPWYRTWWMYLSYTASGLLVIGLFITWRERNLKQEKAVLEHKVELRTKQLEEKNKIVEEQKKEVVEKNIKITDSINYAKRIQNAILPSQELIKSFFPDSFVFFRPKDIVSGDFYWFSEKKDKLLIAVADCTGHGVPGAFMSMIGNTLLNEIVNVKNISDPDQILNHLSKGIVHLLRQSNNESDTQDDGMDISIAAIDKTNGEIEYSGANHFMYIFNSNNLETLQGDIFSIGGMFIKEDINFSSNKVKINKGDTIYLFTDGFADQFGGEKNTKFLSRRFGQLLQSIQQINMEQQQVKLITALDDWKGNKNQTDDILIVGIRI